MSCRYRHLLCELIPIIACCASGARAAPLVGQLLVDLVPQWLGVDEHPVHVKDDGFDRSLVGHEARSYGDQSGLECCVVHVHIPGCVSPSWCFGTLNSTSSEPALAGSQLARRRAEACARSILAAVDVSCHHTGHENFVAVRNASTHRAPERHTSPARG